MSTIVRNIGTTLEMIKIEHTLFALPFAFLGAVLAARGIPTALQILWITLAMVGARSTAMAFNRAKSTHQHARDSRRSLISRFRFGIHFRRGGFVHIRRRDA